MSFSLLRDVVRLEKQDGRTLEGVRASVQRDKIFLPATDPPLVEGDFLVRELPGGVTERYLVLDTGYYARGVGGVGAHYQAKVRKETAIDSRPPHQVVYNLGDITISGENARFNLHSADLSTNVIDVGPDELFAKLKDVLASIGDEERRYVLLGKVASMQKAQGTPGFAERYKEFVSTAADHMTLLAPFIPALTQLLTS